MAAKSFYGLTTQNYAHTIIKFESCNITHKKWLLTVTSKINSSITDIVIDIKLLLII